MHSIVIFRQWNSLKWDENCKLLNGSIWQFVFVPPKVPDSALWWLTFGESSSVRILKRREGGLLWTIFCKHWVQHSWFPPQNRKKIDVKTILFSREFHCELKSIQCSKSTTILLLEALQVMAHSALLLWYCAGAGLGLLLLSAGSPA